MRKKLITVALLVVAVVLAIVFFNNRNPDRNSIEASIRTDIEQAYGKPAVNADKFDRQFENADGTMNREAESGHIGKEIAETESDLGRVTMNSQEREKLERRLKRLKEMKDRLSKNPIKISGE